MTQNTLEGKLYAVDTARNQIAVYVSTGNNHYKPAWQTVSTIQIDTVKDEMCSFIMYREGGLIFYDAAKQMESGNEYLAVKEAVAMLLGKRQQLQAVQ